MAIVEAWHRGDLRGNIHRLLGGFPGRRWRFLLASSLDEDDEHVAAAAAAAACICSRVLIIGLKDGATDSPLLRLVPMVFLRTGLLLLRIVSNVIS